MPSLIPGYEYDIFISYRHNDNHSGWVTEFVKNLQQELAAAIKEPVSVYLDSNPHDGLLETHNVDKSLQGKLKCLIFIPILSQTYCDEKSFAWQHEFIPFNKIAQEDPFGRDVRLPNGNVASRILPVRIHELDQEDKAAIENVLGPLRAVDFIFKSPGINRPLRFIEEHTHDNLNKTFYRDQINRIANAIKDLISSLKSEDQRAHMTHESALVNNSIQKPQQQINKKSLAVLPFANISSDPEQEYFSDGITEDIIAQISKIHDFKVISRTSVMQYKRTQKSILEISSELKVSYILEGSVRSSGNRLRIVAQLIDARKDVHLWTQTYDRDMTNVFAIQAEIAENIAGTLKTRLTSGERKRIAEKPTTNLEAYNLYLLGRSHYHNVTPEDFDKAIDYFYKAIALDPHFAMAYAALAVGVLYRGAGYYGIRPHDAMPEAFRLAQKALELDPNLSDAYAARAEVYDWYFYNWEKAEEDYSQAIELNPSNATAHLYSALHLIACRRFDEAIVAREIAVGLDPYSTLVRFNAMWIPMLGGRAKQSLEEIRAASKLAPNHPGTWMCIGLFTSQLGLSEESISAFRRANQLSNGQTFTEIMLIYSLARFGHHQEARSLLAKIHELEKTEFVWPMGIALAYAHLGETKKALDYLELSYEERVGWMIWIGCDPTLDILRNEGRFKDLVRKIGPPKATAENENYH